MSGFEVIGVVLGVWPLVVNGLHLYKAAKNGQGWELLYDEFRTEEYIYVECVQHLLASDTSEADLLQLTTRERPNHILWKDPALQRSLQKRLGPKSDVVLKTLWEMDKLLQTLSEKIKNHEIALESSSKLRTAYRNVKIILPQATVKDSLRKLRDLNGRLQRLLMNSTSSGYPAQGRATKSSTKLPPDVLRRISDSANDLHDAIYEGYHCDCYSGHDANLGLHSPEDVHLIQPFEIVFPVDEDTAKQITQDFPSPSDSSIDEFDTKRCRSISIPSVSTITNQRSNFTQRRWSHRGSVDTMPSSLGNSNSPPFRGRAVSLSKSNGSGLEHGGLIDDLCNFIRRLGQESPMTTPASCLGVLGVKEKKYTVQVTSLDGYISEPMVSLDDYLSPPHKAELTRKKRMDLALSLSLAILQFYKTPWIDMWWTWKDFCVLKGDKCQIFVTKRFYSSHSPLNLRARAQTHSLSTSAFWDCFGEPVLTRLGFALVELALGQRLSELREKQDEALSGDEDMLDLITARNVVDQGRVLEEAGQVFNDAVQACLTHQVIVGTGVAALNSKHPNFQLEVERFVVAPIKDSFEQTWGLIPKMDL